LNLLALPPEVLLSMKRPVAVLALVKSFVRGFLYWTRSSPHQDDPAFWTVSGHKFSLKAIYNFVGNLPRDKNTVQQFANRRSGTAFSYSD